MLKTDNVICIIKKTGFSLAEQVRIAIKILRKEQVQRGKRN